MAKQIAAEDEETVDTIDPSAFASAIGVAGLDAVRAEFLPRYRRFRGELRQKRVGRGDNAVTARDMIDQAFQDRGVDVEIELRKIRMREQAEEDAAAASDERSERVKGGGNGNGAASVAELLREAKVEIAKMRTDAEAEINRRLNEADEAIAKMKEEAKG